MRGSHFIILGLVAASSLAVVAGRARGDCKEEDKDERGKCPVVKPPPPPPPPRPTPRPKPVDTKPVEKPDPPPVAKSACPAGMVHVPAGTFVMGSAEGNGVADEHPAHKVTLSGYCIDKTEVTVAAYAKCVSNGGCTPAAKTIAFQGATEALVKQFSPFCNANHIRDEYPVNCVDWDQSKTYCEWANKRLPTEAEWEYAARGSDGRAYPWGDAAPSAKTVNACGSECVAMAKRLGLGDWKSMFTDNDGWESTAPVGSYPAGASPFGVLDMIGNVQEWTSDAYGVYPGDAQTDPTSAGGSVPRVTRGGGWSNNDPDRVHSVSRYGGIAPDSRTSDMGFRCTRGD